MNAPAVHDFQECLARSHAASDDPVWERIYRQAFPDFSAMVDHRGDGYWQRQGVDRSVTLNSSKQILVDEKMRERAYDDILLEYESNNVTGSPGWVRKPLQADYIAYYIKPAHIVYMLPVIQLQGAWTKHGAAWLKKHGTKEAVNDGYKTLNCPVPVKVLFSAIGQALRIRLREEES